MAARRSFGGGPPLAARACSAAEAEFSFQAAAARIADNCIGESDALISWLIASSSPVGVTLRVELQPQASRALQSQLRGKPSAAMTRSKMTRKSFALPRLQIISTTVPCRSAGNLPLWKSFMTGPTALSS